VVYALITFLDCFIGIFLSNNFARSYFNRTIYPSKFCCLYTRKMTETITVIRSPVPLTTVNNLFSITHQLIDQYRRTISIFAGTGIFLFFFQYPHHSSIFL
jgi:hypothetical protein